VKLDRTFLDRFAALGKGEPPAKKLALLIRPAFVAPAGKTLVWGDWSNIEARVLPWLADSKGAEAKLDIFRAVDRDPKLPDVYMRTAADLLQEDADELWAAYRDSSSAGYDHAYSVRQSHGKVPELSLGFGGSLGALQNMATNYGVYLDDKVAADVVKKWRAANQWAVNFWGYHGRDGSRGLWGAINRALEEPNTAFTAGRVAYVYDPTYLGGTVFCALPCGRLLTYPSVKWERREVVTDKKTGATEERTQLTCLKGYARVALWHGKLAENITQASAASVLRRTLKRLNRTSNMDVVMHTHDEVVLEAIEELAPMTARLLKEKMVKNDDWDQGLPLAAEITTNWYYTKAEVK
jgi:DNA polymerase